MNFYCVIDAQAFIWDRQKFDQNGYPYYQLAGELMTFFDYLEAEKPRILLRKTLRDEMVNGFPCDAIQGIPNFRELSNAIYGFLGSYPHGVLGFDQAELDGIQSDPNIVYNFYNATVKSEIVYLISHIHQGTTESVYFTFQPIWTSNSTLKTSHGNILKEHQTIVSTKEELKRFFDQFKLTFVHHTKHDKLRGWRMENGVEVAPLSCDNGETVNEYAQELLFTAISSTARGGLFNYDDVNGTFVHFYKSGANTNIYHGFDEREKNVPTDVRNHFHK